MTKLVPVELIEDVERGVIECLTDDYYGKFNICVCIQAGKIRNVNYTTERSKKYE